MARPKEFDVDEALERALEAFWQKGYEATSLQDLVKAMGIQKASLYATFGDKRQLFLKALDRYQSRGLEEIEAALLGAKSKKAAIRALILGIVDEGCTEAGSRGCFCTNVSVELGAHDKEVRAMLRRHDDRLEQLFIAALTAARKAGELPPRFKVERTAGFLSCLLLGLNVLAKTSPGSKKLLDAAEAGLSVLER